ncbi:putative atp-dependent dna ligase domain-containing protein [Eutypa lata UCREL1]|uniref:Putative atp-dependent dna ligase domain-containing protein n=1 Tax=Eutypa lata (strain UCR-EL1) TaxID=1287681 RepID=M7TAJ9_EUTLA|nr:putative atp-dependent dna ligase domain-containing protein [Eutypa lata UCREL1]
MVKGRNISVEQKMDGEYCQIHIDISKGSDCIQIFSKSGKDSTNDRASLHGPHSHEHLMIIYYDILMIDDESLLNQRQSTRRRRLENIITCQKGYAEIVKNQVIACRKRTAAAELREVFARCITNREEGVVLKPDTPYFDFTTKQEPYACCSIKLKKEYIQGWGDVGDFAVIGARYDAAQAKAYKIPNLKWTHFYIGCLNNRNQVKAGNELARFTVVNIVEINETLMRTFLTQYSPETMPFDEQEVFDLELHGVALNKPPAVVFVNPVIFDVRCFSFDKEPNSAGWNAITYDELQEAAKAAVEMPPQEDSQELRAWIAALEKADPRGIAVDAFNGDPTVPSSGQSDGAMSRTREQSQQTASSLPPEPNVATCPHAGHKCALAKWSFLVSPYITTYAWVTESLLKDHGITNYIVDPSKWTKGKGNTRRARKICLVESKNKGATEAFLKKVEEANLQTRSGKREWIAVYDWRVLEKVTELESLGSGMGNYDPWRQFYIGIA